MEMKNNPNFLLQKREGKVRENSFGFYKEKMAKEVIKFQYRLHVV